MNTVLAAVIALAFFVIIPGAVAAVVILLGNER